MANISTDFLRFNAYSIKDLITRKLSEDSKFTDQIYEGSNLAILIDIVSYMFQCLTYSLNTAASESMFSDTQVYENINRLVKFIGYNPSGIIPASARFYFDNTYKSSSGVVVGGKYRQKLILKYSAIDTGKTDNNGDNVYYSLMTQRDVTDDKSYELKMQNGRWKYYKTTNIASGTPFETFTLNGLGSYVNDNNFVANGGIDVYIERRNSTNGSYSIVQYSKTLDELFVNTNPSNNEKYAEIFKSDKKVYSLRLNENKIFEIKFGDGIVAESLVSGDIVHIFYFDTNGLDGGLTLDEYSGNATLKHSPDFFGISEYLYYKIFMQSAIEKSITSDSKEMVDLGYPELKLLNNSTSPMAEENVEDIRQNAPNWFKTGNRLITREDFVYYIKNKHNDEVIDCICQNNFEYISTFFKWLYTIGIKKHNSATYYLNQNSLIRKDYTYADPADNNNIYIWTKLNLINISNVRADYIEDLQQTKALTIEPIFLQPIDVNFAICAAPEEKALSYLKSDTFDEENETYIEITLNNDSIYINSVVQTEVESIINNFFTQTNLTLGTKLNYNTLVSAILSIGGVDRVRTIYSPKGSDINSSDTRVFEGLCFATWSSGYIDVGDDLDVSNSSRQLEVFQFPALYTKSLTNKIKVIKKSINNSTRVQY